MPFDQPEPAKIPCEYGLIIGRQQNVFLKSEKRLVDVEYPEETVGDVLRTSGLSFRRPAHSMRNAHRVQSSPQTRPPRDRQVASGPDGFVAEEENVAHARNFADQTGNNLPGRHRYPVGAEEHQFWWGDQFLEPPPSRKPAALLEILVSKDVFKAGGDISQVGVAHFGSFVPAHHGIDGLGELSTAGLVDATRIDPKVPKPVSYCYPGCFLDFDEAGFFRNFLNRRKLPRGVGGNPGCHILERDFPFAPCVRENGILGDVGTDEVRE